MGNRGILHDPKTRTLGTSRWKGYAWIICVTSFKGRGANRKVMGEGYTELFFLDEVTALAAGHRPCFECRNKAAKAYQAAWQNAEQMEARPKAGVMDRTLHQERLDGKAKRHHGVEHAALADGAVILLDGMPMALKGDQLLQWSFEGYERTGISRGSLEDRVTCLTPPSTLKALANGYAPEWHPSVD